MAARTLTRCVQLGSSAGVAFPSALLGAMTDSSTLLADPHALRARLAADGYLLLRGVVGRDAVLRGRQVVLDRLAEAGVIVPGSEDEFAPGAAVPNLEGRNAVTHHPDVISVLEGAPLRGVMAAVMDGVWHLCDCVGMCVSWCVFVWLCLCSGTAVTLWLSCS